MGYSKGLLYIDDLDEGICSDLSKFVDDTKMGRVFRSDSDARALQGKLDKVFQWFKKWQMQSNISKCSVLSVGRNNPIDDVMDIKFTVSCRQRKGLLLPPHHEQNTPSYYSNTLSSSISLHSVEESVTSQITQTKQSP